MLCGIRQLLVTGHIHHRGPDTKGRSMSNQLTSDQFDVAVRDVVARAAGVVGLAGIGLIHLLDLPSKMEETPYLGWMYIGLIVGAVLCALDLVRSGSDRTWLAGGLLAVGALTGYTLTRTVGLPNATGDIGNWLEPLGLASLFVELTFVALSGYVLGARARLSSGLSFAGSPSNA
jgi:hypothetical protein